MEVVQLAGRKSETKQEEEFTQEIRALALIGSLAGTYILTKSVQASVIV